MGAMIAVLIVGLSVVAGLFVLSQARKRVALEERIAAQLALHAGQSKGIKANLSDRLEITSLLSIVKKEDLGGQAPAKNTELSQPDDVWEFLQAENMVKKPRTKVLPRGYVSGHRFI